MFTIGLIYFIGPCYIAQSGFILTVPPHPLEYRVIGICHHAQLKTVLVKAKNGVQLLE